MVARVKVSRLDGRIYSWAVRKQVLFVGLTLLVVVGIGLGMRMLPAVVSWFDADDPPPPGWTGPVRAVSGPLQVMNAEDWAAIQVSWEERGRDAASAWADVTGLRFLDALVEMGIGLSTILHDWDDDRASAILHTIRSAAANEARLIVMDAVIPAGNERHGAKWLDLLMLALFAGRERGEAQWRALLASAEFEPCISKMDSSKLDATEDRRARVCATAGDEFANRAKRCVRLK